MGGYWLDVFPMKNMVYRLEESHRRRCVGIYIEIVTSIEGGKMNPFTGYKHPARAQQTGTFVYQCGPVTNLGALNQLTNFKVNIVIQTAMDKSLA